MNVLDLFAGAGGSILAGKLLGWRTVCAVELDPYCRRVLLARQRDGILPLFPIWDDIRTFDGREWRGRVDVVTAGFPCQPFSAAGKRRGAEDERNLWPETIRVIREVRPRFALCENVPALLTSGYFPRILWDLAEGGFDARWCVLSAAGCGAPHIRKRLWIVAYADLPKWRESYSCWCAVEGKNNSLQSLRKEDSSGSRISREDIPDADESRLAKRQGKPADDGAEQSSVVGKDWWQVEPDVGRVADGVASRVDRLRALGNGWVPIVAAKAWAMMTELTDAQASEAGG